MKDIFNMKDPLAKTLFNDNTQNYFLYLYYIHI
jgi:hypothetical protein